MTHLKIGDQAPNFEGLDQHGEIIKLANYKGKKIVIYFYPKDNTPGCTAQACNLRDNEDELQSKNIQVIGISADSVISHGKFSNKFKLNFPLIADTDKIIIHQYGVWGAKKFMGRKYDGIHRTTFVLNEEHQIIGIIEKPNTKNHTTEILELIK